MFGKESFARVKVTEAMKQNLANAANNAITKGTWASYKPVIRHLERCQEELGVKFSEPAEAEDVLAFISYMAERGLRADTTSKMLSAWRMLAMVQGKPPGNLRPTVVTQILKGFRHEEEGTGKKKPVRQAMTISMLKLLRMLLKKNKQGWSRRKKQTIWSASLLAFWGGFRGSEILAGKDDEYDSHVTLLKKDVWLKKTWVGGKKEEYICIRLKSSKTSSAGNRGEVVEVFKNDTGLCAVKEIKKYMELNSRGSRNCPFFREDDGKAMTLRSFNSYMKLVLEEKVKYGAITCHSFRQGLATWMASRGHTEQEIMAAGRWDSSAWTVYVRRPKLTRIRIARNLAKGL